MKKIVVFVPVTHAEEVRKALGDADAGHIGNYSHCTFGSEGVRYVFPSRRYKSLYRRNWAVRTCGRDTCRNDYSSFITKKSIKAMLAAHPYEEVAYDVYPLDNKGETLGLGKIGYLQEEMTLEQFALHVKQSLHVKGAELLES